MTRDILCKFENESIIAAGDGNLYLDPKMYKSDSISHKYDNYIATELKSKRC